MAERMEKKERYKQEYKQKYMKTNIHKKITATSYTSEKIHHKKNIIESPIHEYT